MKRKILCVLLAALIILASVPMTAFAAEGEKTITDIEITPTRELIQYYGGWRVESEETSYYHYDLFYYLEPEIVVHYSDGTKAECTGRDWGDVFSSIHSNVEQTAETEYVPGANTTEFSFYYDNDSKLFEKEFTFYMIENPVESISVVANKPFIEELSGDFYPKLVDGEYVGEYFGYFFEYADIWITINYKDGREAETYSYCGDMDNDIYECTGYDLELNWSEWENPLELGETVIPVSYLGVESTLTVEVIENPVESIEVTATKKLEENKSGFYEWIDPEDESQGKFFYYNISEVEPVVTVNYNDGRDSVTCAWSDCYDVFGYFPEMFDEQFDGVYFEVGVNTVDVEFMGLDAELEFEILPDPIESITVTPTTELREFVDGAHIWADDEDPFKGIGYFEYDLSATYPVVTVTFNDGRDPVTCGWYECYDLFEDEPSFDSENARFNVGENTVKVDFLGRETDYTFTIEESPVKNVSAKILNNLTVDVSGYMDYESRYDEETDEYYEVPYFRYDIDNDDIEVTIEYKDESKEADTFTLNNIHDYFDETSFVTYLGKQDSETKLTVGEHKGILAIFGKAVEFDYEIAANPVKKVEVIVNNELIENRYGYWTETEDGEEYYYYFLDDLDIDLKVTFTDGTVKEYKTDRELNDCSYPWEFEINQEYNPFKKGENSAKIIFNGVEAEFTIKVVDDPVKSVTLTPTKAITQYVDGWLEYDDEGEIFYHDVYLTYPDITFNYKDGTKKTYSYAEYGRFFNGGIDFDTEETRQNPMKLGENTVEAYVYGYPTEYTFVLKKADKEVTKFEIAPEKPIIENTSGIFILGPDDELYPIYFPNQITYTVKLTYSDGTTKTYKNVKANDKIEGSYVGVDFHCYDFSERYVIGAENTAVAWYRNHSCEFKVSVAENTYTAAALSGDTDLKLTLTKKDGTKEVYTAKYFEPGEGDDSFVAGTLYTDKGELSIGIGFDFDEKTATFKNFELIYAKAGGSDSFIRSNKLESNKWLNTMLYLQMHDILSTVGSTAAMFADGYAKYYFGTEFTGFGGTFKGVAVDEALTTSAMMVYIEDFEYVEEDEKGAFTILTLDEAKDLAGQIFDVSKIDFASSPSYDAKTNTIKVRLQVYPEGYLNDQSFKYQNGKYILTMNWEAEFSETVMPVRIVVSEAGIIESVSFTEASSCGDIKTITAVNAKGGVKVTYSAADNATEYEIYRSTNGAAAVKIATTSSLEYLDTTAKSNTTYTYKVRGINSSVQGNFSGVKTVKYLAMPVTTAKVTKTGFTVSWNKVDGASTYRIYRAQYANGKWSAWAKISDQKASVSSFADKDVKAGGVYKYTVRALASGGVASAYEGTASLVYLTAPKVTIANAKTGVKVTWSAVAGAKEYVVYRSEKSGSSWSKWTALKTTTSDVKTYTDTKAVSGKTYRYTVKAINGKSQGTFVASAGLLFLAEPVVTTTNAKAGITVKWGKIAGAQSYTIYRAQYNSSTKKWSGWSNMGSVKSTSWTDKGVKAGLVYKYTVRAVNGKTMSTYTAAASIVRLVEAKVTIANAKTGVTVKWNKVASTKNYVVYRSEQVNGKWSSWKNMGTLKNTVFAWTDTSAVSGTIYRYTVRAVNGKSQSSFTASKSLMFLAQPKVTFANASNGMKVSWNKVDGATQYIVYSATYNAKTKKWSGWTNRGKVTATTWTDKTVKSGTYYKYTVKAVNGSYTSTYMAVSGLLRLAQPTVKAAETINGINVTWNKIAGAKNYVVYRSEYVNGAWTGWTNKGTLANTKLSWLDTNLVVGAKYRYTVKAINNKAGSSFKATGGVVATETSAPYVNANNVKAKMTPLILNYHSLYEAHDYYLAGYKNYKSLLSESWYKQNDPYHYTARLYKFKTVKSEAELRNAYKQYLSSSLVDSLKFGNLVKINGTMYFAYMAAAGSTSYDMNSIKFVGEKDGGYLVSVHCYNSGDVYCQTETFLIKNVNGKMILDSKVDTTYEYDDIYVSPTYDSVYNYYNK